MVSFKLGQLNFQTAEKVGAGYVPAILTESGEFIDKKN